MPFVRNSGGRVKFPEGAGGSREGSAAKSMLQDSTESASLHSVLFIYDINSRRRVENPNWGGIV